MSIDSRNIAKIRNSVLDLNTGKAYRLGDRLTTIGRAVENDIVLRTDMFTSRKHAVIKKLDHDFYLEDIGSSHGTLHNGRTIEEAKRLVSGDEIWFGSSRFSFVLGTAA